MKISIRIILFIYLNISTNILSQDFEVIFEDIPTKKSDILSIYDSNYYLSVRDEKDSLRLLITEKAIQYLGVNYKYGQAGENGFDCSGYVKYIYNQFGYNLPRSSYEQYSSCKILKHHKAKPGDLVFFVTRGQKISHVGIYLGNNYFIHSPKPGKQVCIDTLDMDYYKNHLAGFGTFLNINK